MPFSAGFDTKLWFEARSSKGPFGSTWTSWRRNARAGSGSRCGLRCGRFPMTWSDFGAGY
jgi:hypothetical protein